MTEKKRILLASHGTSGAKAAEIVAMQNMHAGDSLFHLLVVPEFWEGMTGDDWLLNATTRNTFRRYLEDQLTQEVEENLQRVKELAEQHGLAYESKVVIGEPTQCLLNLLEHEAFHSLVLGSPRPKGMTGLRSKIAIDSIRKKVSLPIIVTSYPELQDELNDQ